MTTQASTVRRSYRVTGMECAGCAAGIQTALTKLPAVDDAAVDYSSGVATVAGPVTADAVLTVIRSRGFEGSAIEPASAEDDADLAPLVDQSVIEAEQARRERAWRIRAIVGLSLWLPMEALHWLGHSIGLHGIAMDLIMLLGATIAVTVAGSGFFASAFRAGRHGQTNMDTLVSLGVASAYGVSLVTLIAQRFGRMEGSPLWFAEAAALLGIISLGIGWKRGRVRRPEALRASC